jgi:hypothetical protein
MKWILFLILIGYHLSVLGQWGSVRAGLPFLPMTGYSAAQQDVFSFTGNPASGAFIRKRGAGVYAESRFVPADIHFFSGSAVLPLRQGSVGLCGSLLRAGRYAEAEAGFVYSLSLGSAVSAGVGFSMSSAKALSYRNHYAIHSLMGLLFTPLPCLRAGIYARDPAGLYMTSDSRRTIIPSFCFGIGYEPSTPFFCGAEFLCESGSVTGASVFFQYIFKEKFFLRSGYVTASSSFFAGAGFSMYGWRMIFLVSHHPMLGQNSSLLLTSQSALH